jgi:hypothetical protein
MKGLSERMRQGESFSDDATTTRHSFLIILFLFAPSLRGRVDKGSTEQSATEKKKTLSCVGLDFDLPSVVVLGLVVRAIRATN